MTPTFGEIPSIREVLLAAKRANDFGRGAPDVRLQQVEPLIHACEAAIKISEQARALYADLVLNCVRTIPVYPQYEQYSMGSEKLADRWVVSNSAKFNDWIMKARAMFPKVEE